MITILRYNAHRLLIAFLATVIFAGCSDDSNELLPDSPDPTEEEKGLTMDLSASAPDYVDAAKVGEDNQNGARETTTRSWTPPSGYFLYGGIYDDNGNPYVNFTDISLTNKSIDAYFTRADGDEPTLVDPEDPKYPAYAFYPYHARLRYKNSTGKWELSIRKVDPEIVPGGDYYVYGFIPSDAADDATISDESNYALGATLTIKGLRTAGYDACVIIGAREGFDENHDGRYTDTNGNSAYDEGTDTRIRRLTAGDFKFNLDTGTRIVDGKKVINPNYLYLLFDHLGSALTIGIKVDGDYNTLRTIKLKQLTLQTATESGLMTEKADVVVTLNGNNTGTNPITTLTYTQTGAVPEVGKGGTPVYQSDNGKELTTSYQSFLSHFLPIDDVTKVVITCTYDVYDKKENLLHKDCKATNTIRLSDIIPYFPGVQRGWKYGINMTVVPTYLYVLSDPDLDNPTMIVG